MPVRSRLAVLLVPSSGVPSAVCASVSVLRRRCFGVALSVVVDLPASDVVAVVGFRSSVLLP